MQGLTCTTLAGTSGSSYGGWQTYNTQNGTLFGTPSSNNCIGIGSGTTFYSANVSIRCIGGSTGSIVCLADSGLGCTLAAGGSSFAASSDERLKTIITDNPYPNALDDILTLKPIRYRWSMELFSEASVGPPPQRACTSSARAFTRRAGTSRPSLPGFYNASLM